MNKHATINLLKGRSCDNCRWNAEFWIARWSWTNKKQSPRWDHCLKNAEARQAVNGRWDDVKPKERTCHAWVAH